ncbi:hypothetical protein C8Q80DRAFT_1204564 [Daedaleopsis nitida]|nr:hypothetical protein C8Q80DRAFT_1204564 [Daedaleopsis nitida]
MSSYVRLLSSLCLPTTEGRPPSYVYVNRDVQVQAPGAVNAGRTGCTRLVCYPFSRAICGLGRSGSSSMSDHPAGARSCLFRAQALGEAGV